jgi:polyphosphate glucokinase
MTTITRHRPRVILSVDVGGSHAKVTTNTKKLKREFVSCPGLSAKAMVNKVVGLTEDWFYDVVSVGHPSALVRGITKGIETPVRGSRANLWRA